MTSGYQSILDLTAALLPVRMLEWHYRSRDEKLISLSNAHMYGGSLVTFPGNVGDSPITWHPVQYTPVAKGEERSNKAEVEKVVDLILEHAARSRTARGKHQRGRGRWRSRRQLRVQPRSNRLRASPRKRHRGRTIPSPSRVPRPRPGGFLQRHKAGTVLRQEPRTRAG